MINSEIIMQEFTTFLLCVITESILEEKKNGKQKLSCSTEVQKRKICIYSCFQHLCIINSKWFHKRKMKEKEQNRKVIIRPSATYPNRMIVERSGVYIKLMIKLIVSFRVTQQCLVICWSLIYVNEIIFKRQMSGSVIL